MSENYQAYQCLILSICMTRCEVCAGTSSRHLQPAAEVSEPVPSRNVPDLTFKGPCFIYFWDISTVKSVRYDFCGDMCMRVCKEERKREWTAKQCGSFKWKSSCYQFSSIDVDDGELVDLSAPALWSSSWPRLLAWVYVIGLLYLFLRLLKVLTWR